MKLVFERSMPERKCSILPGCDVPEVKLSGFEREKALNLPELSENDISRHSIHWARVQ